MYSRYGMIPYGNTIHRYHYCGGVYTSVNAFTLNSHCKLNVNVEIDIKLNSD